MYRDFKNGYSLKHIFSLLVFFCFFCLRNIPAAEVPLEKIIYDISPIGYSDYQDFGLVPFSGSKANLVIFKTSVAGFDDTERIYSHAVSGLPLKVERDVSMWFHKENIVEDYSPSDNKVEITKFESGKETEKHIFKSDSGPINNGVLLPFSLRKVPNLKIGWSTEIRLPEKFTVKLVSKEEIEVPAGKFKTLYFTSTPHKFDIWISDDDLRLPVKIRGDGVFSYTLSMKERITESKKENN